MTNLSQHGTTHKSGLTRLLACLTVFALIHAALLVVGFALSVDYDVDGNEFSAPTLWPSTGFALAVLLLCRRRHWPALLAILLVVEILAANVGWNIATEWSRPIANIVSAVLGATLIRNYLGSQEFRWGLKTALTIVAASGAAAAVGHLTVAPFVLKLTITPSPAISLSFHWLFAAGIGMIFMAPLVLTWWDAFEHGRTSPPPGVTIEAVICLAATAVAAQFVFSDDVPSAISALHHPYLVESSSRSQR